MPTLPIIIYLHVLKESRLQIDVVRPALSLEHALAHDVALLTRDKDFELMRCGGIALRLA